MRKPIEFVSKVSVFHHQKATVLAPVLAALGLFAFQASSLAQGSLTPSGAPAPTMKSLDQIEPRIPISAASITINSPGSYYFTTNLTGVNGQIGIQIGSGNVTLDLNGFALQGVGGSTLNDGIAILGNYTNITVRNGAISGWGGLGFNGNSYGQAKNVVLERLMISGNGNSGVSLAMGVVRDCVAANNSGNGFFLPQGGLIENCLAQTNGSTGYNLGQGSLVQTCKAIGNPSIGINAGVNCRLINCEVLGATNNGTGINLATGGTAEGCTVAGNVYGIIAGTATTVRDCVVRSNDFVGIRANANSRVLNNLVEGTIGGAVATAGIELLSTNAVVDGCQVVNNNVPGILANNGTTVAGNLIIRNLLRGNTTAFNVSATNIMGPVISAASGVSAGSSRTAILGRIFRTNNPASKS